MRVLGMVLIAVALLAFLYGGLRYDSRQRIAESEMLPVGAMRHRTVPISPIIGVLALLGGVALMQRPSEPRV